jgi:hypothetical protein
MRVRRRRGVTRPASRLFFFSSISFRSFYLLLEPWVASSLRGLPKVLISRTPFPFLTYIHLHGLRAGVASVRTLLYFGLVLRTMGLITTYLDLPLPSLSPPLYLRMWLRMFVDSTINGLCIAAHVLGSDCALLRM